MAEKTRYPQIPSTVWWGVRAILQKTPNTTVDDRLLSVQLGVQEAAARAYVAELKSVGLLTEEGKATAIAQKWRLDETYAEAARQLVSTVYPEGLLNIAPPEEGDRQKIASWFMHEGLGQGAAGNKAATYLLIGSANPNEPPMRAGNRQPTDKKAQPATGGERNTPPQRSSRGNHTNVASHKPPPENLPLNVNVQIHISADAGAEQIESIFRAMRRYLYDAPSD